MARGRNRVKVDPLAKRKDETDLQWRSRVAREQQEARDRAEPIVPVHAQQHGDYVSDFVTLVEDGTKAHTKINRGGSPVERWIASGKLSQGQQVVIATCLYLWRLSGLRQALTANYGHVVGGLSCAEHRATTELEAREDLRRYQGYFPGPLAVYFNVFENVVRHGIPAGVAGSELSKSTRTADARAHQVVCFVADVIATREGL